MAKRSKPIHFIHMRRCTCTASCIRWLYVLPIDLVKKERNWSWGTFKIKDVTCKKCLKSAYYKEQKDKQDYPLFFWKDNVN